VQREATLEVTGDPVRVSLISMTCGKDDKGWVVPPKEIPVYYCDEPGEFVSVHAGIKQPGTVELTLKDPDGTVVDRAKMRSTPSLIGDFCDVAWWPRGR
jgi:hypothetical protein